MVDFHGFSISRLVCQRVGNVKQKECHGLNLVPSRLGTSQKVRWRSSAQETQKARDAIQKCCGLTSGPNISCLGRSAQRIFFIVPCDS